LLFQILGPKQSPLALPIASVYLLIFLTGLSGNLLTCAVIAKHRKMRTPTNLYLLSLAACDLLLLLVAMPLELYDLWQNYPFPFGEAGCYLKTFLFETVCFSSILSVTALSAERYVAVVHPLKTRHLSTNRHARRVLGGVWLASMACAVPNTLLHGVYRLPERAEESAVCTVLRPLWVYKLLIQVTTVCFYLVPMAVISALYLVMAVHLRRERMLLPPFLLFIFPLYGASYERPLTVVVAVFGLCWAPFHAERLLWSSVSQWTDAMHGVYQWVHILSGVLFYLSSAVNPLIYSLLSTRFRQGFRQLVCCSRPLITICLQ
uniref:Neuromedin U receptor 3 n=1 Tax=Gadus morhua TaxID=8049 RepID=A0A8C4YWV0_GADMO